MSAWGDHLEAVECREIELGPLLFEARAVISERYRNALGEVALRVLMDDVTGDMCLVLHSKIWAQTIVDQAISYPADWWQAFKERWFPTWALKRWPVQNTTHHIKLAEACPEYVAPELGRRVRILVSPQQRRPA